MKNFIIGLVAVVAFFMSAFALTQDTSTVIVREPAPESEPVNGEDVGGIFVGGEVYSPVTFLGGLVRGLTRSTSTAGAAMTLAGSDFDDERCLDITLNGPSATVTFPASSTLKSFLPKAGMTKELCVRNATTTAGLNITFAGSTGSLLKKATSTAILASDTDGGNTANFTITRLPNQSIVFRLDSLSTD